MKVEQLARVYAGTAETYCLVTILSQGTREVSIADPSGVTKRSPKLYSNSGEPTVECFSGGKNVSSEVFGDTGDMGEYPSSRFLAEALKWMGGG